MTAIIPISVQKYFVQQYQLIFLSSIEMTMQIFEHISDRLIVSL